MSEENAPAPTCGICGEYFTNHTYLVAHIFWAHGLKLIALLAPLLGLLSNVGRA